ncbi:MAG: Uma2 family endonuclease [Drouetiella hepatica Uher 2000/2452]|jgi:Uma2 family endonuclease|uniref:Uma2 family endonuclease n=1 Tax=Drouetiella hepatica Uher 2000/2452 TaxID=904376 RepID=A0A951Q7E3_9CYAN|nr:Uma2 family endonuclease [Drouetiella hepatica Uher 2000/2452]
MVFSPPQLKSLLCLTDDEYFLLCQANPDLRIERNSSGDLIIMSPTGGETGHRNIEISFQVQAWSRTNDLGFAFDSSTEFKMPGGANYSPDASWVRRERWNALTPEQKRKFPPLAPDFVIELRSPSDSIGTLRVKMQEYIDNGVRLGWLIDPKNRQVEIYRLEQEVEVLKNPETLSGEDVLPGFVLDLKPIFADVE